MAWIKLEQTYSAIWGRAGIVRMRIMGRLIRKEAEFFAIGERGRAGCQNRSEPEVLWPRAESPCLRSRCCIVVRATRLCYWLIYLSANSAFISLAGARPRHLGTFGIGASGPPIECAFTWGTSVTERG